jgi:type IV secretory pathway VirJ component
MTTAFPVAPRSRRRWRRNLGIGALVLGLLVALGLVAPAVGLIDNQAIRVFGLGKQRPDVVVVYMSGDMGLGHGLGQRVAPALATHGIPVIGVSSPLAFAQHRSAVESEAIIARAIHTALDRTGARRVVLMGQSFGSDIIAAMAPGLPANLRARIAAVALVVPSHSVYFRADPTGITYHGTPDANPTIGMRGLNWAPVICIYGITERDSLCPALHGSPARVIGLPGGHSLNGNGNLLVATLVKALHAEDPTIFARSSAHAQLV